MDFDKFPKIDAHFHSTYRNNIYLSIAQRYNIRFININTCANVFPPIDEPVSYTPLTLPTIHSV